MKDTMSNFFPMLSSSPPPIDDIDNPENDDDDDDDDGFGTFATANTFDCSFDSPTYSKSIKSNGESCLSKRSENDTSEKVENVNSSSNLGLSSESTTRNHISAPNPDIIETYIICENGISVPNDIDLKDIISDVAELNHDLQKKVTSDSVETGEADLSAANNSSLNIMCNNDSSDASPVPSAELSSSETVTHPVFVENDVSSERLHSKTLCDNKNVNNLSIEDAEISCLPGDLSIVLPCAEFVDSTLEPLEEKEKCNSDSSSASSLNQVVHLNASSSGEVPDLTFVPFTDPEVQSDEGDNFADFQSVNNYGDVDSDLQGEAKAEICDDKMKNEACTLNESNSDDDEFGNFESGEPAGSVSGQSMDLPVEGFADFSRNEFDNGENVTSSMSSSNFADFESASSEGQLKTSISPPQEHFKPVDKISTILSAVFPISEESQSNQSTDNCFEILENSKSRRLWERLQENEELPGLPFQWSVSHSFQQLLRSVNVDYHSILRTSTVPFFASGLGLLEPTKSAMFTNESRKSSVDLQDMEDPIPPVHFDWGSSGLVNPLDCSQAISTLMDITFLNRSGSSTPRCDTSRDFSFEAELLSNQVTTPPETIQKAPIVEHILSLGAKSSIIDTQSGSRPSGLSQETMHALDQLPNLSYMRAQMLMFPVSSDNSCS